ncbi:hemicentin-1-like [Ylistrum balloti]|uniref:hemicentin-1-like n=1 Tax=Ylistrum balloti TaxID=509963 RepID=UPI002905E540|nr:hemicentin-1-like [Ylistrum balloti]
MFQQQTSLCMFTLIWITFTSTDAVTLTGSSQYAVPGSGFTLTCDVPEEAEGVRFYRRPEVTSPEGVIQVGGDQCYNVNVVPPVLCTPDICSCVTSGGLGTVFRWIIQPQTGDHGSVWFCTRTNTILPNLTLESADYTFNIAGGPSTSIALSPPDTTYTRTEGDTLPAITCTADCRPSCTFVWTRPDNTNFTVSPVLSLEQLDRSEHGTYRCTARNIAGESTSTVSVSLEYGPGDSISFEPQQDSVDVVENQTITDVTCSANCRPLCFLTWSKSGTYYPNPLNLSMATRTNAGQYTCRAFNPVSYGTKTWNLIVRFPPRSIEVVYSQGDVDVREHESKSLICTVESYPPSTIQWLYKATNTILLNTHDVLESTFTLTNVKCLDTGLYTCVVRNSVSATAVTRDIPVNVLCKPRQDQRVALEHTFVLATSETLVIPARFLSNPEPSYSWSFQSPTTTAVTDLADGRNSFNIQSSFVMMNLSAVSVGTRADIQESWFGVYNVTATNSQGSHTLSFTALAKENPRPPKNLSVSCGNPYSVDVSWNNGGYTNYFHVLYSTDNFIQSVTYPTNILEKKGEANDVYSVTIDNLEGDRLYFFKVIAYNSNANRTSFKTAGCKVQEGKSCSTDSMYITGVVLTCIGGLMITLTFGLGIFISRNGRLPLTKGRRLKDNTFENVQLHEQDVHTQGNDERSYQQLDRSDIGMPSVYSEIGQIGNQQQDTNDDATDNRNYESLKGRSRANVYDELQNTASGSQGVYTNTS